MKKTNETWLDGVIAEHSEKSAEFREQYAQERLAVSLSEARRKAGLTQAEVGKKIGKNQTAIARLELDPYKTKTETLAAYLVAIGLKDPIKAALDSGQAVKDKPAKHGTKGPRRSNPTATPKAG